MLILLLPAALLGLIALCRSQCDSSRDAVVRGSTLFGTLAITLAETTSLLGTFTSNGLALAWVLAVAAIGAALLRRRWSPSVPEGVPWSRVLPLVYVAFLVGLVGLLSPPNNFDSMTYHMARVVHWIQNHRVGIYPTGIWRQNAIGPGAEILVAEVQALSGTDRFVNLVQWAAMVGTWVVASLIARQLGTGANGQWIAATLVATLPMGILQGSSTQNNYILTFWLCCFVSTAMKVILEPEIRWRDQVVAGLSLGLAGLTQPIAAFYALPFLVWMTVVVIARRGAVRRLPALAVLVLAAVLVNAGHMARMTVGYGSPMGPTELTALWRNEGLTAQRLASNVLRHLALHMGTPVRRLSDVVQAGIERVHGLLGVAIDDPATTLGTARLHVALSRGEDDAGNPLHLVLVLASTLMLSLRPRRWTTLPVYAGALWIGFVLLAAGLKWAAEASRYHLPWFALWCPLVAVMAASWLDDRRSHVVTIILIGLATPWLWFGHYRPIIGTRSVLTAPRAEMYFWVRPTAAEGYLATTAFLKTQGCRSVALELRGDDYEYPFWPLLGNYGAGPGRIDHVQAFEAGSTPDGPDAAPCAIVAVGAKRDETRVLVGKPYVRALVADEVTVFLPRS